MTAKKEILILTGPGFSDQEELGELAGLQSERVILRSVYDAPAISEFASADVVILRGPWTASPEERLLSRALADRVAPGLQILDQRQRQSPSEPPLFLGIGRGALIAMASGHLGVQDNGKLDWVPAFEGRGPWIEAHLPAPSKQSFMALVQGRALPSRAWHPGLAPWLTDRGSAGGPPVGYRLGKGILLSFVDILGFGDRTQMPDYGYRELASLPTQEKVLKTLIEADV